MVCCKPGNVVGPVGLSNCNWSQNSFDRTRSWGYLATTWVRSSKTIQHPLLQLLRTFSHMCGHVSVEVTFLLSPFLDSHKDCQHDGGQELWGRSQDYPILDTTLRTHVCLCAFGTWGLVLLVPFQKQVLYKISRRSFNREGLVLQGCSLDLQHQSGLQILIRVAQLPASGNVHKRSLAGKGRERK